MLSLIASVALFTVVNSLPAISPALNPALNPAVNPILNPALNPAVNPILNPALNPAVNPVLNPALNPVLNPALNPAVNPLLNPAYAVRNVFGNGYRGPYYNPASATAPILSYSNERGPDGSYSFSFTTGDGKQTQEAGFLKDAYIDNTGSPQGTQVVQGSYSYTSPEGIPIQVSYVADENGFRPSGVHIPANGKGTLPLPVAGVRPGQYNPLHNGLNGAYDGAYNGLHGPYNGLHRAYNGRPLNNLGGYGGYNNLYNPVGPYSPAPFSKPLIDPKKTIA